MTPSCICCLRLLIFPGISKSRFINGPGSWDFINGGGLLIQGEDYTKRERERWNYIYIYIYIYIGREGADDRGGDVDERLHVPPGD